MLDLLVTYDSGATEETSVDAVLSWREWSQREAGKIAAVATGDLRRFSTEHAGEPCDIERRP